MTVRAPVLLDLYAALSHKAAIGPNTNSAASNLAPTWVPRTEVRRLNAYKIRAAYANNVARYMARSEYDLVATDSNGVRSTSVVVSDRLEDRREYGDAALLIDRVQAGVLGDNFEIVVDGADADLPDEPELPDRPEDLPADADEIARRVHVIRERLWTDTVNRVIGEWEQAWNEQPALRERQEWLRGWADDELFATKLVEAEQDICGLGDGVYVLSFSPDRPLVDVYDPGFYFPVLTDTTRGYPSKVHLAWEFDEEHDDGSVTTWVRRLTWELGPIRPAVDINNQVTGFLEPVSGPDGIIVTDRNATAPEQTALRLPPGAIVRAYPWNVDDQDKPVASGETCYFTDARWRFDDLGSRKVDDFDESKATFAVLADGQLARQLDLRHDFLPVIHIPNTPASREHFGQSVIDLVLQVLDDIQIGDTDIQDAAALAAGPAIALSGDKTATETLVVKPGAVYNVGANGKMDVLDLSKGLDALRSTQDGRLERLSINGRVPAEVLGRDRKDGNASTSGTHELLKFGPFVQLIGKLRMSREPKYALLLKFVQRLGQLAGLLPPGANPPARIAFGSFLPADRKQLVDEVTGLLKARAISTQTAVALLVAGGFQVDDARGEVQRIHAENTEAAKHLADATGSEELAADYLGVELPGVTNPPGKVGPPPAPHPVAEPPA